MKKYLQELGNSKSIFSVLGLVLLIVVSSVVSKEFLQVGNVLTIVRQASILLILSAGLTAVLVAAEIDLSVGAVAGLIGCLCAQLIKADVPTAAIFPIGIILGGLVGCLNGFLVGKVKLPSFVATYGTTWVASGFSIIVMNGAIIYDLPSGFTWFGTGYIGFIPVIVIVAALVTAIMYFVLQKTTLGLNIYTFGANPEAARYSAIPVERVVFSTFTLCGMCAGLAGLLMTARLNAADAAMGSDSGMLAIAAVVIGGTSLLGGEGSIVGTVAGALILTIIVNVMNLLGISSFAQPLVVGAVILLMAFLDVHTKKMRFWSIFGR
ncbi:MAG: ABC transporter permease [Negativicutes bacterium]|nr:ABC transporter permease [Negativicutes bacterium]